MISPINLLGNMSEKEFTQKFWGKTPCHIGSVIENYSESITSKYLKKTTSPSSLRLIANTIFLITPKKFQKKQKKYQGKISVSR